VANSGNPDGMEHLPVRIPLSPPGKTESQLCSVLCGAVALTRLATPQLFDTVWSLNCLTPSREKQPKPFRVEEES